ncbi:MAG: DUF86 domain-containing protein [Deltaproteobacteria bacterium]|nr:DUF86 domain-containing protein [Deltaproteobacteria bacterium]
MQEFVASVSSFAQFKEDRKTVFAVVRAFELMGEATKSIPTPFRRRHPGIPWREMAGMRDKVIHEYFGVDVAVLWKTATEDVPAVTEAIRTILESESGTRLL